MARHSFIQMSKLPNVKGRIQSDDVRTPEHPAIADHLEVCKHLFQNGDALML